MGILFPGKPLRVNFEDYQTLFQAYASEEPEDLQTAQQLDRTVAQVALQAGHSPRQVIQFVEPELR